MRRVLTLDEKDAAWIAGEVVKAAGLRDEAVAVVVIGVGEQVLDCTSMHGGFSSSGDSARDHAIATLRDGRPARTEGVVVVVDKAVVGAIGVSGSMLGLNSHFAAAGRDAFLAQLPRATKVASV